MKITRTIVFVFLAFLVGMLQACQSTDTEKTLQVEEPVINAPALESVGNGSNAIAMMLVRSGGANTARLASDYRNGAYLAVQDLGLATVKLNIIDSKDDKETAIAAFKGSVSEKTRLIVTGSAKNIIAAAQEIGAENSVPVIALSASKPGASYRFLPSGNDSLVAGIDYGLAQGKQRVIAFVPKNAASGFSSVLEQALAGRTVSVFEIPYDPTINTRILVSQNKAPLEEADMVVFSGTGQEVGKIAREIRTQIKNSQNQILVSRSDAPSSVLSSPGMEGVIVAMPDTSSTKILDERYRKTFGTSMPANAAYAYDAVAIGIGLLRANGDTGISKASLERRSGFTAATGAFKLLADGRVNRLFNIARIKAGRPEVIRQAQRGF